MNRTCDQRRSSRDNGNRKDMRKRKFKFLENTMRKDSLENVTLAGLIQGKENRGK